MTHDLSEFTARREDILKRMARAAHDAGRSRDNIKLVAVSKKQPDERIEAALESGHRVFGENRVQEAQHRWSHRRAAHPDLELRLIGPLQTNKASDAVALFDVVETLDRMKLAHALEKAMQACGRTPRLLVQVNTGEEPQKSGVLPRDLSGFLDQIRQDTALKVDGLMCIPPAEQPAGLHFALLDDLAKAHGLTERSMGMSSDFETAIKFGATSIRVGSALMGERPEPA